MIKTFFRITLRNLWRNKGFAAINIAGLAIGMSVAMLIMMWIQNEVSMDRFHEKGDRTYLMYNRDKDPSGTTWAWPATPKILGPTLKRDYADVEDMTRVSSVTFLLSVGDKKLNTRGFFADSSFLKIFSFKLLHGNPAETLKSSYNIVLTEKLAKKLFGNEDAMGKVVRIDSVNNCTVTGVLKDLPNNTQFRFEYLLPWSYMEKLGWSDDNWGNNSIYTYTLLKEGTRQADFDSKIKNVTISHSGGKETTEVFTQPLRRSYLYSSSENGKLTTGPIETVRLFGVIAGFILLIACINFMNLSTARSEKRAKEVGIRKVVGAQRERLILQFLVESILLACVAFALALLIVETSLTAFNELVGKQLFIDFSNPLFWLFAAAFILFTGILAGSYPAFFLSSFQPVKVLKGTFRKVSAAINPRKVLVVVQFTFAIILIISTIVVQRQIQHALDRDAGYNRNNLVYTFTQGDLDKHYRLIRHELVNSGAVLSVTRSSNPITQRWNDSWGYAWEGSSKGDEKIDFIRLGTDADLAKTTGIQLIEGRDINVFEYATDSSAVMLNEAAVKAMRLKNPIGKIVKEADGSNPHTIVGVVKDFVLESPYQQTINPMMIFGPGKDFGMVIHMKLNPSRTTADNLAEVEKIFRKYNPEYPFEIVFADESYSNKFYDTKRTAKLAALFAGLTIFISCLGLFALAAYMAENRTKEIGVRKVLGASTYNITSLLSKDFLKLVIISFVIASPVAWYAMNKWLDGYSYRINIDWWIFVAAGVISVLIAFLTISFQSVKAAMTSPVKNLRTE